MTITDEELQIIRERIAPSSITVERSCGDNFRIYAKEPNKGFGLRCGFISSDVFDVLAEMSYKLVGVSYWPSMGGLQALYEKLEPKKEPRVSGEEVQTSISSNNLKTICKCGHSKLIHFPSRTRGLYMGRCKASHYDAFDMIVECECRNFRLASET